MTIPQGQAQPTFGYLLVVEDELFGHTGGLLIVCERGRPLEFHCTEPVQTTRAQEILFGPTLPSYVRGEQIGQALLAKAKLPVGVLLTLDQETATAGSSSGLSTLVLEPDTETPPSLATLSETIDPVEPFERVREAIREAQRLVSGTDSPTGGDERAAA